MTIVSNDRTNTQPLRENPWLNSNTLHTSSKQALPSTCRYCDSENLEIREGKGPHVAGIWCADCQRHQKWLNKTIAKSLGFAGGVE